MIYCNYEVLSIPFSDNKIYNVGDIFLFSEEYLKSGNSSFLKFHGLEIKQISYVFSHINLHFDYEEWRNNIVLRTKEKTNINKDNLFI